MSLFRNRRLSADHLGMVLRSLPQAKAPADLEEKLDNLIAENREHIPHVLGTLPLISAPEDFDARLMDAIHARRRPVPPFPQSATSDPAAINWINHITGWVAGSVVAVGLAFFVHSLDSAHRAGNAPIMAPASATAPASAAPLMAPAAPAHRGEASSHADPRQSPPEEISDIQMPSQPSSPADRQISAPVVPRASVQPNSAVEHAPQQQPGLESAGHDNLNAATHELGGTSVMATPSHEDPELAPIPAKVDSSVPASATSDSNNVSAGMGENVDTGGSRPSQESETSAP